MKKKALALAFSILLLLSLIPTAGAAGSEFNYSVQTGGKEAVISGLNRFDSPDGALVLPESIPGLSFAVTGVAPGAFDSRSSAINRELTKDIVSVTVPAAVVCVGEYAFAGLEKLETVTFEGNVTVGEGAFAGCAALKAVSFVKGGEIGENAFSGCEKLASLTAGREYDFDCPASAVEDTLFYKEYPVDYVTVGSTLIAYKGADPDVTVPLGIMKIGPRAFSGNEALKKVKISRNVTSIGDYAFADCKNLESVTFAPDGAVSYVGSCVFDGTEYLNSFGGEFFTVGSKLVKYMGENKEAVIPNFVTAVAGGAFNGCFRNSADGGSFMVETVSVPASCVNFEPDSFALASLPGGGYLNPVIYAYPGSATIEGLEKAGIEYDIMPVTGDVDSDGSITASDARLALRIAVDLEPDATRIMKKAADIDGDGEIRSEDARTILRLSVGLEAFKPEDLLGIPTTDFERLSAYTSLINRAGADKAGYTKTVSTSDGYYDMSAVAERYILPALKDSAPAAGTVVYEQGTLSAVSALDYCSLVSTDLIKSSSLVRDRDKYVISLEFGDTGDNGVTQLFPARDLGYFKELFAKKLWFRGIETFTLTYTDCSAVIRYDPETAEITDLELIIGYRIELYGKLYGASVSSGSNSLKNAVYTCRDTVFFENFIY